MKPVKVKSFTFDEIVSKAKIQAQKNTKRFENNGGMCLNCGERPGILNGHVPYNCKECNKEVEGLLKKLRGPGFMELKI